MIDPTARELDRDGRVLQMNRIDLAASLASASILQRSHKPEAPLSDGLKVAREVLNLLNFSFKKRPEYTCAQSPPPPSSLLLSHEAQQWFNPSHQWASDKERLEFRSRLASLAAEAANILKQDAILLRLTSPAYVLGDLHGSYKDLDYFAHIFWDLGVDFTPSKFVFLGDYVDRGPHSVEVIAYLLSLKLVYPHQVFLLRGNHEFADQNGLPYEFSFRAQCHKAFENGALPSSFSSPLNSPQVPNQAGEDLWLQFNATFSVMPLAAIIDEKIFCVHGGIPRLSERREDLLACLSDLRRPLTCVLLLLLGSS